MECLIDEAIVSASDSETPFRKLVINGPPWTSGTPGVQRCMGPPNVDAPLPLARQVLPPGSILSTLAASMLCGAAVVVMMTPFDVIATRLYNQGQFILRHNTPERLFTRRIYSVGFYRYCFTVIICSFLIFQFVCAFFYLHV